MEITLDKKNTTEGLIKIKLSEGDYQPQVEEKLKEYARKASIKGFRPGKVPAGVVKRMYGKSVLVDEINHILSHKISDYIKENNIKILGDPLPNKEKTQDLDWESQKDFEFEYHIGMVDDFSYDVSKNVKVKSYPIEVDGKIMDDTLADLKKRFGTVTNPEVSEANDTVYGELTEIGSEFKLDYAQIEIAKVSKEQQPKFIGLKKDDSIELDITKLFDSAEDLSELLRISEAEAKEKTGTYALKVVNISRTEPSEMNPELFDRVFGKDTATTEEEFVEKVKQTISENYNRESIHFLDHAIEDYFIENTTISLPDNFLKEWLLATSKGEVTADVIDNEFKFYRRGLVWDLIKNRIAEENKILVEGEEVRSKAREMIIAQFGGQAFADQLQDRIEGIVDNYLKNENGQNFTKLYHQLRNEKILNYIKANISIDEKKVNVEEFKKIVESHKH